MILFTIYNPTVYKSTLSFSNSPEGRGPDFSSGKANSRKMDSKKAQKIRFKKKKNSLVRFL